MRGAKTKSSLPIADPLETGREFVRTLGKPSKKWFADEAAQSGKTFLEQILGLNLKKDSGAVHADAPVEISDKNQSPHKNIEIFNLIKHKQSSSEHSNILSDKAPHSRSEGAIDYHGKFRNEIIHNRERVSKSDMREMHQNIEQIKVELSKLITSSQVLKLEFAEVAVEQSSPTVGQYHLNFFEWMLTVIRAARQKVEDSGSWLNTVQGKGAKRGYWGMFKQHGTMFGLSGERAVATQVG